MSESAEVLEERIDRLRVAVRQAIVAGDRERARALRADLKRAELAWETVLEQVESTTSAVGSDSAAASRPGSSSPPGPTAGPPFGATASRSDNRAAGLLLPLREQVHQALSLLTVPAAPRLIAIVHEAFFAMTFPTARITSLRRDEERSFRIAPFARPYYICSALTADLLAPARGLLAISTWPMERRVIGPLSSRVDFLTAAIQVAEAVGRIPGPSPAASGLLWRFAASIPGAADNAASVESSQVVLAARAELGVHKETDLAVRRPAAQRARNQLDDVAQLFGNRLGISTPESGSRSASAGGGTAS